MREGYLVVSTNTHNSHACDSSNAAIIPLSSSSTFATPTAQQNVGHLAEQTQAHRERNVLSKAATKRHRDIRCAGGQPCSISTPFCPFALSTHLFAQHLRVEPHLCPPPHLLLRIFDRTQFILEYTVHPGTLENEMYTGVLGSTMQYPNTA